MTYDIISNILTPLIKVTRPSPHSAHTLVRLRVQQLKRYDAYISCGVGRGSCKTGREAPELGMISRFDGEEDAHEGE